MKRLPYILLTAIAALTLWACGDSDAFTVEGDITGNPTMNLRIVTYGTRSIGQGVTASNDGKFAFKTRADGLTMVEIYDNDYRLLGRVAAENGDRLHLHIDRNNPLNITAEGNELSTRWADYLRKTLAPAAPEARRKAVETYVGAHKDDPLSALLLLTEYDAAGAAAVSADSLYGLLGPDARLTHLTGLLAAQASRSGLAARDFRLDSLTYIDRNARHATLRTADAPLTLLVFSREDPARTAMVDTLRMIARHIARGKFAMTEISTDGDTLSWRRSVRTDTATWRQGWLPGGVADRQLAPLGLQTIPAFVAVDSAGHRLWQGRTASEARTFILTRLSR